MCACGRVCACVGGFVRKKTGCMRAIVSLFVRVCESVREYGCVFVGVCVWVFSACMCIVYACRPACVRMK